ncbi:MAG TPA: ABC transporter permease [Candidatus Limnocylindria bacterium]|nr:ABC transporter permease [Candidatus Limnocylindria bacterium]
MTAIARRGPAPAPGPTSGLVASLLRSRRLVQRNLLVYKRGWMVIFSGFFEPLFYLLGIGYGLGTLVGDVALADGRSISYAAFVAPALLAQASMNGAIAESIFNVFFKLNFSKTYDAILATPLGIREIAVGEMLWSLFRGTLYVIAFVLVMIGMGLVISPYLFLVIPASILIGAAFSAACLATTAYLRTVQDFDLPMGLVVMPMFLFSGTFFPIDLYPQPIQLAMELTPLFHAVGLLRGLATGLLGWHELWDLAYIAAFGAIAMWIALNRLEQRLIK